MAGIKQASYTYSIPPATPNPNPNPKEKSKKKKTKEEEAEMPQPAQKVSSPVIPSSAIFIIALGSFVHGAGHLYPGSPYLQEAVTNYMGLSKSNPDVSAANIIVHLVSNSEELFQTILIGIQMVYASALIIQTLFSQFHSRRLGIKKAPGRFRLGLGGGILWALCAAAVVANVYAVSSVPKFVQPSSLQEVLPMIPKCLQHRFGLFSLLEIVALLTGSGSVGRSLSSVESALFCKAIALAFFVLALAIKYDFDVNRVLVRGSLVHRFHMGLIGLQAVLLVLCLLPTIIKKNYILCASAVLGVGLTMGFLLSDEGSSFLEPRHMAIVNALVLSAAVLCTILGGSSSCLALVLVFSAMSRLHEELLQPFL